MNSKCLKIFGFMVSTLMIMSGCGKPLAEQPKEEVNISVAVPAADKGIIRQIASEYENENENVSVNLIDATGSTENIHRFYMSALFDKKFGIDVFIIDDVWLPEFASSGYVREVKKRPCFEELIPAVRKAASYNDKFYGVPIYADAMVTFKNRGSVSDKLSYYECGVSDMTAHLAESVSRGLSLKEAYIRYKNADKCSELSDYAEGRKDFLSIWLSRFSQLEKYYLTSAIRTEIKCEETGLIKTRLAVINADSENYDEALKFIESFVKDNSQDIIIKNKSIVPIFEKHYRDEKIIDRCQYISGIDGKGFKSIPCSVEYNKKVTELQNAINTDDSDEKILNALSFLEE